MRDFTEEDVREAIGDCDGSKSPWPDGFTLDFFKAGWEIVKEDVMRFMHEFHMNGKLTRGCNASFITLIPKNEGSCNSNNYMPISMIGSIYKILAKVLARRMKPVMDKLIGDM